MSLNQRFYGQMGIVPIIPPAGSTTSGGSTTPASYPTTVIPSSSGGSSSSSGGGWNGMQIFNTVSAVISQALQAFGKNPTSQVGTQGVYLQQTPQAQIMAAYGQQTGYGTPYQTAGQQVATTASSPGAAVGTGIDGIFNWLMANPMYLLLGVGGAYLLFREPPKRR